MTVATPARADEVQAAPVPGRAATAGREVVADELLSGAFSHASPLSYPYVLERLVPELAAAADGDPSTPVPSAAGLQAA